jgi:urease beta subunit
VLRVDADVRELANSRFRFVAGADGAEVLQSVNYPDRFVTVAGAAVRIEPGPGTAFRRRQRGRGVTLEVAAAPGTFLRHEHGIVTVGRETTFLLGQGSR